MNSKPTTFGEWNRQHVNDLRCPALVDAARASKARKEEISRRFANLFDGSNFDAATAQVVAELGCSAGDVERSESFEAAYSGETVEELRRIYG